MLDLLLLKWARIANPRYQVANPRHQDYQML